MFKHFLHTVWYNIHIMYMCVYIPFTGSHQAFCYIIVIHCVPLQDEVPFWTQFCDSFAMICTAQFPYALWNKFTCFAVPILHRRICPPPASHIQARSVRERRFTQGLGIAMSSEGVTVTGAEEQNHAESEFSCSSMFQQCVKKCAHKSLARDTSSDSSDVSQRSTQCSSHLTTTTWMKTFSATGQQRFQQRCFYLFPLLFGGSSFLGTFILTYTIIHGCRDLKWFPKKSKKLLGEDRTSVYI